MSKSFAAADRSLVVAGQPENMQKEQPFFLGEFSPVSYPSSEVAKVTKSKWMKLQLVFATFCDDGKPVRAFS